MLVGCGEFAPPAEPSQPDSEISTQSIRPTEGPSSGSEIGETEDPDLKVMATPEPAPTSGPEFNEDQKEYLKCLEEDPHPVALDISERFETPYQEVEDWYCRGNLFENNLLALMTSRLYEIDPDQALLEQGTKSWDEIWTELDESLQ